MCRPKDLKGAAFSNHPIHDKYNSSMFYYSFALSTDKSNRFSAPQKPVDTHVLFVHSHQQKQVKLTGH